MRLFLLLIGLCFSLSGINAATIEGIIYEEDGKTPVSFASIAIKGTTKGVNSDLAGYFKLDNLNAGNYQLVVSFLGYQDVEITNLKLAINSEEKITVLLKSAPEKLPIVEIKGKKGGSSNKSGAASIHTLDAKAIRNSTGSANDVMQTIQVLPGMVSPVGFTNEIMIRGGASIENSYYLEGIEIPLINHFSSQGSSNGIRSILNNAVLKSASIHTSAFPIATSNTLSGVFDFAMINGNAEKLQTEILLSTTDATVALNGPLNKYATYSVVFRQAYLKPTLKLLDRPLLATYNDWQYKIHWNLGEHNTLSFIGIGNTDKKEANNQVSQTPLNQYLFDKVLDGKHWHVTNGLKFQNFRKHSFTTITLATSNVFYNLFKNKEQLNNHPFKPVTDYQSQENNSQFSITNTTEWEQTKWIIGGNYRNNYFSSDAFFAFGERNQAAITAINYKEWSAFSELNQQVNEHLFWSIGLKIEGNDFAQKMKNPLRQLSPRVSVAYDFNENFSVNAHAGIYHQLPANITLAHRGNNGNLSNQENAAYFSARQLNVGVNWNNPQKKTTFQAELFHKKYTNYPFSIKDQVALANKGDGFRTQGNEAILPIGIGRAYGIEINLQQQLSKGFQGTFNYTLSKSEFFDEVKQQYLPSAMDARHILNFTLTKQLPNDWHIGVKGRFQSGMPYTSFDVAASTAIATWNPLAIGIKDYSLLNQQRLANNFGLDIRVDKVFSFKKNTLKVYADLMEVVRTKVSGADLLAIQKEEHGFPMVDATNPSQYAVALLKNELSSFIPTLGLEMSF